MNETIQGDCQELAQFKSNPTNETNLTTYRQACMEVIEIQLVSINMSQNRQFQNCSQSNYLGFHVGSCAPWISRFLFCICWIFGDSGMLWGRSWDALGSIFEASGASKMLFFKVFPKCEMSVWYSKYDLKHTFQIWGKHQKHNQKHVGFGFRVSNPLAQTPLKGWGGVCIYTCFSCFLVKQHFLFDVRCVCCFVSFACFWNVLVAFCKHVFEIV